MITTQPIKGLTVKEVSEKYNVSEHTIRYWTDSGLIPTVKRDKNNNRIFDNEAINWLTGVICLKNCGMSNEAIKEYENLCLIGNSTLKERIDIMVAQREIAQDNLEKAKKTVQYMDYKIQHFQNMLDGKEEDISNPYNW